MTDTRVLPGSGLGGMVDVVAENAVQPRILTATTTTERNNRRLRTKICQDVLTLKQRGMQDE